MRAHDHGVAVFEEAARLAGWKRQRAAAAGGDLEQTAEPVVARRRDRAGPQQVAGAQVAAAAAVVRHQLGDGPVEMACVAERQSVRRMPVRRETLREQRHFELDVEGACGLVRRVPEIRQRRRISRGPRRLRRAERRERFGSDDPGRDGGQKALAQERAERLVFPPLDVARGPVVEQAESRDVVCRLGDRDRCAKRVARADPDAKLKLVVETARWPEARNGFACAFALAIRAAQLRAGRSDRGGATVIADRHVFVIRQQRIVRAKELARIAGVVDAGEEVGVIADRGRKLEPAILGAVKEPRAQGLDARALAAIGVENLADETAQRASPPSANCGLSVAPEAASAPSPARPSNSPSSSAAARSKISSPIATPPRAAPPGGANTPSGSFWIGKSLCPLAEATQLRRAAEWVSSIMA